MILILKNTVIHILYRKEKEMDDEWLSVCCGAPPNYRFQFDTFMNTEPLGICSECQDHTHFTQGDDDGND